MRFSPAAYTDSFRVGLVACLLLGAVGCETKKVSSDAASRIDAGNDRYATADPKLAKALQAAASAAPGAEHGPPPNGVFAPDVADQRHPKGAPTTIELVSDGQEPRVSLLDRAVPDGGAAAPTGVTPGYGPAVLELAMQMGPRSALPTIDLTIVVAPAKKDEGADGLVADVKRATPAQQQLGQLPPGSEKDIASLAGTRLRVKTTPDGRVTDADIALGSSTRPELDRIARHGAESLALLDVPLPQKAVGMGAQWIGETRMTWFGADVIVYRAYRLKKIEGDHITLTLGAQAYAANKDVLLPGVPKGATLEQYEAQAQGELDLARGESLPVKGVLEERFGLFFQAPGAAPAGSTGDPETPGTPPAGMMGAKFEGQAMLIRGDELRAAARR